MQNQNAAAFAFGSLLH
ncbi:MAG: hypothetical protein PWQ64_1188, partial [Desulfomicrobiaceae bacterium]|nr:hypothetical protein [Desulfomicrobiaceae bacterium]